MGLKAIAQQKAKVSGGLEVPFQLGADPTSGAGGSYAGRATVGSLLVNLATGRLFACTAATSTSATWQLIGLQS